MDKEIVLNCEIKRRKRLQISKEYWGLTFLRIILTSSDKMIPRKIELITLKFKYVC